MTEEGRINGRRPRANNVSQPHRANLDNRCHSRLRAHGVAVDIRARLEMEGRSRAALRHARRRQTPAPGLQQGRHRPSDRRIPRELRRRQSFQRQSDRRELRCRTMGLPANRRNGSGQAKRVGHERLRKTAGADRRDHAILHHDRATAESSPGPVERSDEARAWSALGIISNPSPPVSIYAIPDLGHRTNEVRTL